MEDLQFTYTEPGENAAPLHSAETDEMDPVAFRWKPLLLTTAAAEANENNLAQPAPLPWERFNIVEVHVESRKAYEILNAQERPPAFNPLVRILPPGPFNLSNIPVPEINNAEKIDYFVASKEPRAAALAAGIINALGGHHYQGVAFPLMLLAMSRVAIFPQYETDTAEYLAYAIAAGCKIVSSDAGASEEYLNIYGRPSFWHVVHNQHPQDYIEAAKDLLGRPNDFIQRPYINTVMI